MNDIITYDDFFDLPEKTQIFADMTKSGWKWGNGSYDVKRYPFWIFPLKDNPFYTGYLLDIIKEKTQQDYELHDVYANGNTFGDQGDFHIDMDSHRSRTFLYYANNKWKPEYNGKTIFKLGEDNYHYHLPKGKDAIIFRGTIPHMAEGCSRLFNGLRITVAWKLLLK